MKGRIKNRHLGHALHDIHAGLDAKQVGRIVQGRNLAAGLDALQNLAGNQHTVGKTLAAMYYAMSHSINFWHIFNNAVVLAG